MIKILSFLVFCLLFDSNDSCGSKKRYLKKDQKPIDSTGTSSFAAKILGGSVILEQYDHYGYQNKRGQAESGSDLSCNLNSACCWRNSDHPYDTMEFVHATGTPDSSKFESFFKTSETPSGSYLLTMAMAGASPDEKADFQSCGISCAADSIRVSLRKWTTDNVLLKVCEVKQSDSSDYIHCEQINGPNGQIASVYLAPARDIYVAIVAQNFVSKNGSGVIISDITVDYAACTESSIAQVISSTEPVSSPVASTQLPTNDDLAECQRLKCDFESGLCNYHLGQGPLTPQNQGKLVPFTQQGTGKYGNRATGVVESPDRTHYAAVYLNQHDRGYLEVEANFDKERTVAFQEYKATVGIQLQVCCDSLSACNYTSGASVNIMDFRQWYKGVATCPAGTKKLIFYAENLNGNQGGVGIDNIVVVQERTSDVQAC